jgi:hypothetical protein
MNQIRRTNKENFFEAIPVGQPLFDDGEFWLKTSEDQAMKIDPGPRGVKLNLTRRRLFDPDEMVEEVEVIGT